MAIELAPTGTGFILSQVNGIEVYPGCVPGSRVGIYLSEGFFLPLGPGGVSPSFHGLLFPAILIDRNPQDF